MLSVLRLLNLDQLAGEPESDWLIARRAERDAARWRLWLVLRHFVTAVNGYSSSTNIADDVVTEHLTRFSP